MSEFCLVINISLTHARALAFKKEEEVEALDPRS